MTESKESKINKCQTSHFINDYTSYIQKMNQENSKDNDNDDNTFLKKNITINSSISQTKDEFNNQSHQDRFMLTSKSLSTDTVEGYYKSKIRFDIKGVPIKKGKPNYQHISYLDKIPPFNNTLVSIHEVESYKMNNAENNFDRLSRDRDLPSNKKQTCCCIIY